MNILQDIQPKPTYRIIHPLFDEPEVKRSSDQLGRMHLTPGGKIALVALRSYLALMILLLVYRVLEMAGIFGHVL